MCFVPQMYTTTFNLDAWNQEFIGIYWTFPRYVIPGATQEKCKLKKRHHKKNSTGAKNFQCNCRGDSNSDLPQILHVRKFIKITDLPWRPKKSYTKMGCMNHTTRECLKLGEGCLRGRGMKRGGGGVVQDYHSGPLDFPPAKIIKKKPDESIKLWEAASQTYESVWKVFQKKCTWRMMDFGAGLDRRVLLVLVVLFHGGILLPLRSLILWPRRLQSSFPSDHVIIYENDRS